MKSSSKGSINPPQTPLEKLPSGRPRGTSEPAMHQMSPRGPFSRGDDGAVMAPPGPKILALPVSIKHYLLVRRAGPILLRPWAPAGGATASRRCQKRKQISNFFFSWRC